MSMGSAISDIVIMDVRVDTATSFDTYAASQSYFSANIVALEAAGADAMIITTLKISELIGRPISLSTDIIPNTIAGSASWRRTMNT